MHGAGEDGLTGHGRDLVGWLGTELIGTHVVTARFPGRKSDNAINARVEEAVVMIAQEDWRASAAWFPPKPMGFAPVLTGNIGLNHLVPLDHNDLVLGVNRVNESEFVFGSQKRGPIFLVPLPQHDVLAILSVRNPHRSVYPKIIKHQPVRLMAVMLAPGGDEISKGNQAPAIDADSSRILMVLARVLDENLDRARIRYLFSSKHPKHKIVSPNCVFGKLPSPGNEPVTAFPMNQGAIEIFPALWVFIGKAEIADGMLNLFQNRWGIFLATGQRQEGADNFTGDLRDHL